jgi:thymidylate kinase
MLLSVLGVNLVIFARLMRPLSARRDEAVTTLRDRTFARYFAADYACSVAWLSTTNLMPVIVTAAAGPTTNAYWALAYAVALPLYAFAQNIGTSLMLHGTIDRTALPVLARKAALQGARVLVPCVAALVLLAPYVLSLFGGSYAAKSTTVLRLLALGALPNLVLALTLHIARVQRRLRRAMIALGSEAVIALGLATPLLHRFGVTGVGIGWLSAQCIVGVGLLLSWRNLLEFTPREPGPVERAISLDRDPDREAQRSARPAPDVPPAHTGQLPPAHTGQLPPAQTGQLPPSQTGQLPPSQTRRLPASQTRRLPPPHPARPHPVLQKLFDALEQAGVRWMLSRLPSSLAAPSGDIDLLVAPADADGLRDTAAGVGFVPLPGWESAPNLILVRYDRPTDQWLLLDVATTVSFRSPRRWQLPGAAEQILRGRRVRDGLAVPADGDAFWLLLLHCLLDKGVVAPHHRPTLRRLAFAALTSPLAGAVGSAAGSELRPDAIVDAVRSGEWQLLADLGGRLRAELKRRRPGPQRLHVLISRAVEFARKPLLLPRRRGLNLALIGPNGAGKSTAAAALRRHLPFDSRVVYMGMWKASGDTRGGPLIVAEIVTRPLRLWWRYLLAQYHQLRGRLVVFDRYVYEAMLPARPPFVPVKRAYFWFLAHAVPPARTVVVLDVPAHLAYGRKQENPPEELECERRFYGHLARRVPAVELVDAAADADTVCADITAIVWRELASRWQGHRACA